MINQQTSLDYLADFLRFHLGDYTEPHRYTLPILRTALVFSIRMLQRRWNNRYIIDNAYNIFRYGEVHAAEKGSYNNLPEYEKVVNATVTVGDIIAHDGYGDSVGSGYVYTLSGYASSGYVDVPGIGPAYQAAIENVPTPVIDYRDEPPIILQASILIKSGSLQEASWQTASWRDDEISVSNIQGDRSRQETIKRDVAMLETYFKRRLYAGSRQSLPGFRYPPNYFEG